MFYNGKTKFRKRFRQSPSGRFALLLIDNSPDLQDGVRTRIKRAYELSGF